MIKLISLKQTLIFMKLKSIVIFIFLTAPFFQAFAQYTETLNSNRPGISQGAFAVGRDVLQIELGLGYGKEKHNLLKTETTGINGDYAIRYGFFREELEVSLIGEYQNSTVTDSRGAVPYDYKQSNFKNNTIGAKYLFYDPYRKRELKGPNLYSWRKNNVFQWEDLIPAISLYVGANFDSADNPYTPEVDAQISPKFVLSTQNNWLGGWVFVTNIIVDRVSTEFPTYSYILTLTHAFNPQFSAFIENQGIKSDFYADQLFRGGAAYLFNSDFQVDASVLLNAKDTPSRTYGRIGVSYRFDFHGKDDFIEEKGKAGRDKKKQRAKDTKEKREGQLEIIDNGGGK